MDHVGQRFTVEVPRRAEATAASTSYERTPKQALEIVQQMIRDHIAIECEIVHPNNSAKMLVIFMGPTRLDTDPRQ
jgi:hypothetical protein